LAILLDDRSPQRKFWRCYTKVHWLDDKHIDPRSPRCQPKEAAKHASTALSQDYDKARCTFQTDGPGIELEHCGPPDFVTQAVGDNLEISFQFKPYFWTPIDKLTLQRIASEPPDLLVVSAGSPWGPAPGRRSRAAMQAWRNGSQHRISQSAADITALEKDLAVFLQAVNMSYAGQIVWLEPLIKEGKYHNYAATPLFRQLATSARLLTLGWPVDPDLHGVGFPNVTGFPRMSAKPLAIDGHCHAGTAMGVRAAVLANLLLNPHSCPHSHAMSGVVPRGSPGFGPC